MSISLVDDERQRGIHMSRVVLTLQNFLESHLVNFSNLKLILKDIIEKQGEAQRGAN